MAKGTRIVNQESVRNVQVAQRFDLQNTREMRVVTRHFTENLTEAKIDILGPLPNGTSVLRITAKPVNGATPLKAHVEVNLSGEELIRYMQQDEFYRKLSSLKLSQFTGYVGEQKLMDYAKAGTLHNHMFMKIAGRTKADSFFTVTGKQIVKDKVWAIQNGSGHGIDFLCEVQPYPPKPKYLTIDAKSTLRASYGPYSTPNGPPLSAQQSRPTENLLDHLQKAVLGYRRNNPYALTQDEFNTFRSILSDLKRNPDILTNYKASIGLTNGFNLAGNQKYANMIVLSRIE